MKKIRRSEEENTSIILDCLYRNPNISRIDISRLTNITPATVSLIVNDLIRDGCLIDSKVNPDNINSMGRKKSGLKINNYKYYVIGLDFNIKQLSITITNLSGSVVHQSKKTIHISKEFDINTEIITMIKDTLVKFPQKNYLGIGLSIPGHFNSQNGKLISNNESWDNFDIFIIRKAIDLPIILNNNVESMALSDYLFQPEKTRDNFTFIHISYGIYYSFLDTANLKPNNQYYLGEIGHSIVEINGQPCECGKNGCLQTYLSEPWLIDTAKLYFNQTSDSILHNLVEDANSITIEDIITAYQLGDRFLKKQLDTGLIYLATTVSNALIIQETSHLFFHSKLLSHNFFSDIVKKEINKQLGFIKNSPNITLEFNTFDSYKGSIGACSLAIVGLFIKNKEFLSYII